MGKIIFTEEKRKYTYFVLSFGYDEDIIQDVRKIPTADFSPTQKFWYIRVSRETAHPVFELIKKHDFECSDKILDMIREIVKSKEELLTLSRAENSSIKLPEFPGNLKPYPFQKAGAKYMLSSRRCFNGDDMGLGKTIQTLVAMEAGNVYPHIIICPSVAKKKWRKEAKKWLPHRSSAILNDLNFSYHYDIMILNYEVVLKYLVREVRRFDKNNLYKVREQIKQIGLKGITCDESHYLKNGKSKRTKAVRALSKGVDYRWLLSGTIIDNRPKEFISQLQILGRLNDLGGYKNFIRQYCDAEFEWHGNMNIDGASNLDLLNKRLRETCMIRRRKIDVLDELPPKSRYNILVDIDSREEYRVAENNIFEWSENNRISKSNNLDLFGNGTERAEKRNMTEEAIELQIINALKLITARGKLESAKKWIRKFLKTGKKLVVFAHHKEIQHGLIKAFPNCARILGGMSPEDRQRNEILFKESDSCNIIICSLKSANVAIDLLSAHNTLTVELGWTPSVHDQAEDRCWRIGQYNECNNYYLLGRDTIDEDIYDLLQSKRKVVESSLDGNKEAEEATIFNELVERLKNKGKLNIPDHESKRAV